MEIDDIVRAALEELVVGPMSMVELTRRLAERGVLDEWGDLDASLLVIQVDDALSSTDDTWLTPDGVIAAISTLLDGAHFTHRVSDVELSRGVLDVSPDLVVLDFGARPILHLSSGADLPVRFARGGAEADEHGSFVGPPDWLRHDGPSTVVLTRRGSTATLDWSAQLAPGEREATALRRAFDDEYRPGVAQEPTDIVLNALTRDPSLFRRPVAPITELVESVGLAVSGDWVGLADEDARPPGFIERERRIATITERFGFERCCDNAFEFVLAGWFDALTETLGADQVRDIARALAHGTIGPAFAAYVLDDGDGPSSLLETFALRFTSLTGPLAALGHYLLARNLEADDLGLEMEKALRAAVALDSTYEPALVDLAWCLCDRGDVARALTLLSRVANLDVDDEMGHLREYARPAFTGVGRNDSCPCGSGRKYKACCLGAPAALEDRTNWLVHKIIAFSLRPGQREYLRDLLDVALDAAGGGGEDRLDQLFPLIGDLAATDEDALDNFLDARGPLLPDDERALVLSWGPFAPSLYQVSAVSAGTSVEVFDTRRAETFVVSERLGSASLQTGDYLYARAVPVGATYQFMGALLAVPLAHRASLLEALDQHSSWELANWLGRVFARPHIVNTEHEDTVLCRAVLRPATPWPGIFSKLDEIFGAAPDHHWTETVEIDGESRVRSFLMLEDDSLVVMTNSRERFTRTLERLADDVSDLVLESRDAPYVPETDTAPRTPATPDPAVAAALAEYVATKETEWLDHPVPALSGLTPREAAGDPSRREDLVALLNEFDRHGPAPLGTLTFNVDRLRRELGVNS